MSSNRTNQSEFAIGIIFVCVGALLLYTQYNVGYWGVLALGIIFIIKNLPSRQKSSLRTERKQVDNHRQSDRMDK